MRLIRPHPGELADRQVILELKIEHADVDFDESTKMPAPEKGGAVVTRTVIANKNKVNVQPFFDELELVQNHLKQHWIPDIAEKPGMIEVYDKLYEELEEANSTLWDLEDKARMLRDAPDKYQGAANLRAAEVLFTITETNDKRAEIVRKINELWGLHLQEKFY